MANEHIGRLQKIGLGKESTPGTAVSATDWIPKVEGVFSPEVTKAKDGSAYGNIDELRDSQTVQQITKTSLKAIVRDSLIGHFLLAAFGQSYPCLRMTMSGGSGTFVVGETVTQATSGAVGVIQRIESNTLLFVSITSGTFTSGSNLITGGTSSATATPTFDNAVRSHVFTRLNSNTHPTYTLYGVDAVGTFRSPYSMLESLEIEAAVGDFVKLSSEWKGKKEASTSATPAFTTSDNIFLAKHCNLYLASALSGLGAAAAVPVKSIKITYQKNLEVYQATGDVDANSIFNKQFKVAGEITALFNATTLKDLVTASTKQAMRLKMANTDVTIGTAKNPEIWLDFAQCSFENWTRSPGNDELVLQTLGFEAEFNVSNSETAAAVLQNTKTTTY